MLCRFWPIAHNEKISLLNRVNKVQECDARDDDSSNVAGSIKKILTNFLIIAILSLLSLFSSAQQALPTHQQIQWHEMEFYLFMHFGPNTFTGKEWGHGDETENIFNPTELDCRQWARIAKAAGAKGIIITAKHHDGFCLWPSQYSTHTVRESKWKDGQGDVRNLTRYLH